MKKTLRLIGALACLAAAVWAGVQLISYWGGSRASEESFSSMAETVHETIDAGVFVPKKESSGITSAPSEPEEAAEPVMLPGLDALYAENSDLAGWISIADTGIDYPVMQTPDEPEYYLRRDFSRSYSSSGTPFLDARCTVDSGNLILWGHNMQTGTMFAGLLKYQDPDFLLTHPTVRFADLYAVHEYSVIAAFSSSLKLSEDAFTWYNAVDFADEAEYTAFIETLRARSDFELPFTPPYGTRLMLLATCSERSGSGRYVVVAAEVGTAG